MSGTTPGHPQVPSSPVIIGVRDGQLDPNIRAEWRLFFMGILQKLFDLSTAPPPTPPPFTAADFAALDLRGLPTSNPGGGHPWLSAGNIHVGP